MSVALVTGAATGIGAATADALAQEGLTVARNHLPGQTVPGYSAPADVSDAAAVDGMVARIGADLGPVSLLVCNAAYMVMGAVEEVGPEDFWRVVDTNLTGSFNCIRACAPGMTTARFGRIVNIASGWGVTGWPRASAYSASKAGVISLTLAVARELGPHGITVNAIAPGITLTDASLGLIPDAANYGAQRGAIRRAAMPDDVVGAALYLASPLAAFVTGQTLVVDGGKQFI
jgi:NAD(P)-dependent dehydrogenase (short-subunit alcohol dehydrogenase family)